MKFLTYTLRLIIIAFLANLLFDLTTDLIRDLYLKPRYFPAGQTEMPAGR